MKSVTNYLLMCIVAIAMFVGYGCSQDEVLDNHWNQERQMSESEKYVQRVHYDTYLSIDRENIVCSDLSEEEQQVLGAAFMRLTYEHKNGLMYIKQSSGQEVNISEQLYDYFVGLANEYNNNRTKYAPKTIRTRSNDYIEDSVVNTDTGCVLWALEYVAKHFDLEYEEYCESQKEKYPNGVPIKKVQSIYGTFANNNNLWPSTISLTDINPNDWGNTNIRFIAIVRNDRGDAHAMVLLRVSGEVLFGMDSYAQDHDLPEGHRNYSVYDIMYIMKFNKL